jgi:hypothetical protein
MDTKAGAVRLRGLVDEHSSARLKDRHRNACGSNPAGYYWSSTPNNDNNAWDQRFSSGDQNNNNRNNDSSVRCVR